MKILIKDLKAQTLLGAYSTERHARREVVLNLEIDYDAARAAQSDRLQDALDYAVLEKAIVDSLHAQTFTLLETLATHVASLVMQHAAVQRVRVEIDKPGALPHARSVAVVHEEARI